MSKARLVRPNVRTSNIEHAKELVKKKITRKWFQDKYPDFRKLPVGYDSRKVVPQYLLREAQYRILRGDGLREELVRLVDACISYVCVNAPRVAPPKD